MTATNPDSSKNDKWIPYLLIPFFAVIFAVNGVFIYFALKTHTGVVSDEAYKEGLAYNQTLERAAENSPNMQDDVTYANGQLTWTLRTHDGVAVTGAVAKARFIRAVQDGYDFEVILQNTGKGVYSAPIKAPLPGAWTVKLDAKWDNQQYQNSKRLTLP